MKNHKAGGNIVLVLIMVYLLVPLLLTFTFSVFGNWTSMLPKNFTLRAYEDMLATPRFFPDLLRTIIISAVPVAITVLIMLLALYTVLIFFPRLEKLLQLLCMIPYAIQGVILSVSIVSLYTRVPGFLSNRIFLLVGAYCIVILPYIFQGIRNAMRSVNMPMLIEAAEMLGASKLEAFFKVIVPNIVPGISVSALLSISMLFGDWVVIRNIAGNAYENVSILLYMTMNIVSVRTATAMFTVVFLVTLLISILVFNLQSKTEGGTSREER